MGYKTVLSFSGGLDSTVLLYHLLDQGDQVWCLNFSYGSRHNEKEQAAARELCSSLGISLTVIDLAFIGQCFDSSLLQKSQDELPSGHYDEEKLRQTVIPGRNTIMISIATGFAESHKADRVAIANHADDHATYPDTRPEWVAAMSLAAWHGTFQRIQLHAPFTHLKKKDICQLGHRLSVPFEKTWTCYEGGEFHCGHCCACHVRQSSFRSASITDPTIYTQSSS